MPVEDVTDWNAPWCSLLLACFTFFLIFKLLLFLLS